MPHEDEDRSLGEALDDVSGAELDPRKVQGARMKEMKYIKDKGVWTVVDRKEAERNGWKVIKTRWIDIDK